MKRRILIKSGALAAAAAPLSLAPGRLYGQPKSVAPADYTEDLKFALPLSRFGIPDDLLQMSSAVLDLWSDVLSTPANQAAFAANPGPYLARFGLDASETVINDSNVRTLTALATPSVQAALNDKNYAALFSEMTALGAFEPTTLTGLQTVLENRLAQQKDTLLAYIAQQTGQNNAQVNTALAESFVMQGVTTTPDDLASLDLVFRDGFGGINPLGVVAHVNVVVSVNVGVYAFAVALIGVVALAAVAIAAFGCSAVGDDEIKPACQASDGDDVVKSKFGSLALSIPSMMGNAERAQRLATLTGDPGIVAYSNRQLIETEITAVVMALNKTGVISIQPGKEPGVIAALVQYVLKSTGLATAQAA